MEGRRWGAEGKVRMPTASGSAPKTPTVRGILVRYPALKNKPIYIKIKFILCRCNKPYTGSQLDFQLGAQQARWVHVLSGINYLTN